MTTRLLFCVAGLGLCLVASPALAEVYKYVDSEGRLHFTQDIGQVPFEYRGQVEKHVLVREISVTGEGGVERNRDRVKAIEKRKRRLNRVVPLNRPRAAARAAPKNRLAGAPEPRKYDRNCNWTRHKRHCRKTVAPAWRAWDAANGGNNGKAVTRRKIGAR